MIIPDTIQVQVFDKQGDSNPIEHVLLGLKIYTSNGSWHNYSPFKTNASGEAIITQQTIIENTGLKWEKHLFSTTPTRYELFVWGGEMTSSFINSIRRLLELYQDEEGIINDLKRRQVAEADIPKGLEIARNKMEEDIALYQSIEMAVNHVIHADPEKIKGLWEDSLPKSYRFTIVRKG
jgi:hypothetical protein